MITVLIKIICIFLLTNITIGMDQQSTIIPTSPSSQSIQQQQYQDNVAQYVSGVVPYSPPTAYQYTEPNYGPQPELYDNNYLIPYPPKATVPTHSDPDDYDESSLSSYEYLSSVLPYARDLKSATITPEMILVIKILVKIITLYWYNKVARMILYRLLVKAGTIIVGGVVLVALGGLFTTLICTFTPFCTIQFHGLGINRDSMRSLMTPDNISLATSFIHDAIERYNKINSNKHKNL